MYVCAHVYIEYVSMCVYYVCMCIDVCLYICIHIHKYSLKNKGEVTLKTLWIKHRTGRPIISDPCSDCGRVRLRPESKRGKGKKSVGLRDAKEWKEQDSVLITQLSAPHPCFSPLWWGWVSGSVRRTEGSRQ